MRCQGQRREGKVIVLTALCLTILLGMTALAIDLGIIFLTRTQLQAASDSGSLSAGTVLISGLGVGKTRTPVQVKAVGTPIAVEYVAKHPAAEVANLAIDGDSDVRWGKAALNTTTGVWSFTWDSTPYNAVGVTTARTADAKDGSLPLAFAKALGQETAEVTTESVAVIMPATGIRIPPGGGYGSGLSPFAYSREPWLKYWRAMAYFKANGLTEADLTQANGGHLIMDPEDLDELGNPRPLFYEIVKTTGQTSYRRLFGDQYSIADPDLQTPENILSVGDGILEMNIYPIGSTAGNFGTVNIGNDSNSTAVLSDQIENGLTEEYLADYEDYSINPSDENPLVLTGDTGISSGIQSSLESVIGQKRSILLYESVVNPGNTAEFTIVEMVGVRFMNVDLQARLKTLVVQPDSIEDPTGIPNYDEEIGEETTFFTTLILAR